MNAYEVYKGFADEPEWMRKARSIPLTTPVTSRDPNSRPRPNNGGSTTPQHKPHEYHHV